MPRRRVRLSGPYVGKSRASILFEPEGLELESPRVLGDGAHDVVGGAVRDLGVDVQGHPDLGPHQPREIHDDFVGDAAGVSADPRRIEGYGAVVTPWPGRFSRPRWRFRPRSERLVPFVSEIDGLERKSLLTVSVQELVENVVHLHVNRVMRVAQNSQELVIFDFLTRLYDSRKARKRQSRSER